ncbi:hypothetical protein C9374_005460 [Naegleria lovaniensis]|uniref:RGS domain-containing protein n=1 Tax=Naegleria lovaniensis TaxID=51637 RepID=A0AA88GQE1_NAELO|nr:uncharacterized protein C9374_005460 [Naegleria lovaniensis]KAG2382258.1 hypothetical protein C9374_005460 [Naegleria lovaniensis]
MNQIKECYTSEVVVGNANSPPNSSTNSFIAGSTPPQHSMNGQLSSQTTTNGQQHPQLTIQIPPNTMTTTSTAAVVVASATTTTNSSLMNHSSAAMNKRVTISSPTTKQPQPHAHAQQSSTLSNVGGAHMASESGKSGSFSHTSKITIRTCCGVVEFTSMKLMSLIGMLVTVLGLLVLAGVAVASFVIAQTKSTDILIAVGKVSSTFETANALVSKTTYIARMRSNEKGEILVKPEVPYSIVTAQYKNMTQTVKDNLAFILKSLDDQTAFSMFNTTTIEASNALDSANSQTLLFLTFNQSVSALNQISEESYNRALTTFKSGLDQLLTFIQNKEKQKDYNLLGITLVQLIVIVISLFIVLPIIIFVFSYAINRDSLYLEKIRRANAIMLMDTMEDDGLRALFKLHCEKEKSIENFLLLEKIQYYRSLCDRSIELQMKLFGDSNVVSDVSSDISGDSQPQQSQPSQSQASSTSSSKKKKESPLEREYAEVESKKYEVAFEIFTDFMEVGGDMAVNISQSLTESVKNTLDRYNDKQIDTLPEDMFNLLEKETCVVMLDTHHRFKQSLAFQKEMKIDKIKVEKLKKKKHVDF